jgi:hypothetical protein
MIEANHLTKRYGTALRHDRCGQCGLTFSARSVAGR